jgi:hypothetical protein
MIQNRNLRIAADQQMIAGVQQHLGQLASIPVLGQSMTPTAIVAVLQERIGTGQAAIAAAAARAAATKADELELTKTDAFVSALRLVVQGMYKQTPGTLADFGLKDRKVAKPSAETKAAAAAKSKATRAARHTMGKNQKKAIHGTVVSPAPAPSPASPASPKV